MTGLWGSLIQFVVCCIYVYQSVCRLVQKYKCVISGFGGAEVACWPLIPKFAGSNPAKVIGFLKGDKKSSARLPSEGK